MARVAAIAIGVDLSLIWYLLHRWVCMGIPLPPSGDGTLETIH
jgi:hypothetical protein